MTGHTGHSGVGCYSAVAVRFAKPEEEPPMVVALAAGALAGVLADCARTGGIPDGLINVAVGPGVQLVELFDAVSTGEAVAPAVVASADQVRAAFKAEPDRFAALAFAHVVPDARS